MIVWARGIREVDEDAVFAGSIRESFGLRRPWFKIAKDAAALED